MPSTRPSSSDRLAAETAKAWALHLGGFGMSERVRVEAGGHLEVDGRPFFLVGHVPAALGCGDGRGGAGGSARRAAGAGPPA